MTGNGLDYTALFNRDLPPPSGPWEGHPKYNFIGGHSDPDMVPTEEFIESAARVFRGDPRNISMYNFSGGPQGSCRCAGSWWTSSPGTGESTPTSTTF